MADRDFTEEAKDYMASIDYDLLKELEEDGDFEGNQAFQALVSAIEFGYIEGLKAGFGND